MKKLLSLAFMIMAFALTFALPVHAADMVKCPDDNGDTRGGQKIYCCGTAQTSIDFNCAGSKDSVPGANTITSLLLTIINFMAMGVGIAVVGGIVFGGIKYAGANGNAAQAKLGKTSIANSVLGLILFILMYAIINFLVPGGLFT